MTDRFTLLSELGRGGMGVVWKARDEETGQIVALKLLREIYAEDASYLSRFERELALAKRIHSAQVVKVLGFGVRQKLPYLALEYVDGPSLHSALVAHGRYAWPDARGLIIQIAQGLADAHAAGVIHRDLKPSNILIGSDGIAQLADFGISRGLDLTRVTATSAMMGTPAYLPPEGPVDERSDLYSLGVIGYQLLTGVVPFEGHTYQEVILAHVRTLPDLNRMPPEARPAISWLLAKEPGSRPQTARQLIRALAGIEAIPAAPLASAAQPGRVGAGSSRKSVSNSPPMPSARTGGADARSRPGGRANRQSLIPVVVGAIAALAIAGTLVVVSTGRTGSTPPVAIAETTTVAAATPTMFANGGDTMSAPPISAPPSMAPAGQLAQWATYGSLPAVLWGNGVARLADGRIAIFSACADGTCTTATTRTWILDPKTGGLQDGQSMAGLQFDPIVATFNDGMDVMIVGGRGSSGPISNAEILDVRTGEFESIPSMSFPRDQATATDIGDGRILVAGGWISRASGVNTPTDSAEVFDTKTRTWSPATPMSVPRALATATRLKDGRVLMAGGDRIWQGGQYAPNTQEALTSAEIYDPGTGTWQSEGNMSVPRAAALASVLPNGDVLVVGGWSDGHEYALALTDEYTPGVGWRAGTMPSPHALCRMVALKDGRIVVIGGLNASSDASSETDIFDPASGAWRRTGDMKQALYRPAAIALDDGRVLMVGGETTSDSDNVGQIEIYTP